ncbi:sigma-70 family RNA polymerase sigma factor [Hephaestia sp. GCM10023244]|uniref:sigma-70 family RNA polymerase sigma factor n=1 Tax=unclassified Hephaestia TaxID=2631281 RepID=UPI00207703F3|nr:sigma-70 family RNA polymerase sigma factor [Hephaestia sp. MAHUQ-44]MCM8730076.1 sigma-70 family RNA polymerase sigma factor [Hephaestia sp. MAHUQ-44]
MAFRTKHNPIEHIPAMRRYARALSRDVDAADDIVQDALLSAYDRAETFRTDGSLKGWLLAIVRNRFLDATRRAKADHERHERLALLAADHERAAQEHQAYLAQVLARFEALPETQRETLHLISVEGLSYRDAAAVLDVPVGTVMSRLSRARAALRSLESDAEGGAVRALRVVGGKDDV